ncbi:hypothetical protein TSUD_92730 [Trifolium subterraneum]|uniref:Uncharacterized protein n=1 Tax=Trifolium subterraneum TaxID=3900 RepID=A0A2Z6P3Z1_TRISU|nr:hypothetical protein TSUD_92730 [Trifolium subterraneum]
MDPDLSKLALNLVEKIDLTECGDKYKENSNFKYGGGDGDAYTRPASTPPRPTEIYVGGGEAGIRPPLTGEGCQLLSLIEFGVVLYWEAGTSVGVVQPDPARPHLTFY